MAAAHSGAALIGRPTHSALDLLQLNHRRGGQYDRDTVQRQLPWWQQQTGGREAAVQSRRGSAPDLLNLDHGQGGPGKQGVGAGEQEHVVPGRAGK